MVDLSTTPVRDLRQLIKDAGLVDTGLVEKHELISRAHEALAILERMTERKRSRDHISTDDATDDDANDDANDDADDATDNDTDDATDDDDWIVDDEADDNADVACSDDGDDDNTITTNQNMIKKVVLGVATATAPLSPCAVEVRLQVASPTPGVFKEVWLELVHIVPTDTSYARLVTVTFSGAHRRIPTKPKHYQGMISMICKLGNGRWINESRGSEVVYSVRPSEHEVCGVPAIAAEAIVDVD